MEIKSQANRKIKRLSVLITILLFLVIWEALVLLLKLPVFILPTPLQVAERFVRAMRDGSLLQNSAATLLEVMGGLASGALFRHPDGIRAGQNPDSWKTCCSLSWSPARPFRL